MRVNWLGLMRSLVMEIAGVEQQFGLLPPKFAELRERCDTVGSELLIQLNNLNSRVEMSRIDGNAAQEAQFRRVEAEVSCSLCAALCSDILQLVVPRCDAIEQRLRTAHVQLAEQFATISGMFSLA